MKPFRLFCFAATWITREGIIIQNKKHPIWRDGLLVSFSLATLKGISQVLLIENVVTGLIVLVAIMVASLPLGLITLLSAIIGTAVAWVCGAEKALVKQGLFGYNSVLSGLALFLFLSDENRWAFALIGAAIATLITASVMHLFRNINIPILTLPFNLLTWILLLATFSLTSFHLSPDLVPQSLSHWSLQVGGAEGKVEIEGLIKGIGQIYFMDNMWSAILVLVGIFWAGWRFGLYAVLGSVVSWLAAYGLGAGINLLNMGLYGYNAVLTMMAISVVFANKSRYSILVGIIAAIFTVPVTASINNGLIPYGLPALTMPFVIVTWIFISARKVLSKL